MFRVNLVSGGVDSFIMSKLYPGLNVYVDFGQDYAEQEIFALKKQNINFETIKVQAKFRQKGIYIPDRNLFLASVIAMTYEPDEIMMAGLKDDNCKDKTKAEFEIISDIISRYANHRINLISPFWTKTKGDIVREFEDKKSLLNTFSCYSPINGEPCGDCPACLRRVIALETNGIETGVCLSDRIIREYLSKIHTYDNDRISRFFIYLKKKAQVYAIDIDGILCDEVNDFDYVNRKPTNFNINNLDGFKILYTSRLECDREITERWMKDHNIHYDALIMNKLPYTWLIDDKSKEISNE